MGSADARSENYILHEPCESTFTVFPDKCPQHHVLDCVNSWRLAVQRLTNNPALFICQLAAYLKTREEVKYGEGMG